MGVYRNWHKWERGRIEQGEKHIEDLAASLCNTNQKPLNKT